MNWPIAPSRPAVSGLISVAMVLGSPMLGLGVEPSARPGKADWEAFAATASLGSFAWAGEDETFSAKSGLLNPVCTGIELDIAAVDPALLTGIPAPEPPAVVLAGLAFGGVLCGRSLVRRRRQAAGEWDASERETPRA